MIFWSVFFKLNCCVGNVCKLLINNVIGGCKSYCAKFVYTFIDELLFVFMLNFELFLCVDFLCLMM